MLRKRIDALEEALAESERKYAEIEGKDDRRGVSASREIQTELLKMRNLESIGTLAGGIAHDFNNLLMAITGYVALAKARVKPQDKIYELLAEAERISLTGKNLTQQLITFSKGGEPAKKIINLNSLVRKTVENILAGSEITARFFIPDGLNQIVADEEQIGQAIGNIVANAREAMPSGGSVTVSVNRVSFTEPRDTIPLDAGNYVRISIMDEGYGISEDVLPRIFDPYFSTKVMGSQKGMGLGLAVVYSIARKHGGGVTVESTPRHGTIFHVFLPLPLPAVVSKAPEVQTRTAPKGKILFMDDEKIIRDIAEQIIGALGYEAVLARNGLEVIDLYNKEQDSGGRFQVVILDLSVRRGMGGRETMERLLRLDPRVKALISSGYTNDPIIARHREFGFAGAITKPYRARDLKELLEHVIAAET